MNRIELAIRYLWALIGVKYTFNGNDAITGFDCVGLCEEALKAVGAMGRDVQIGFPIKLAPMYPKTDLPRAGCLVFYAGTDGIVNHVSMLIDEVHCIDASAGTSEPAAMQNQAYSKACVRVRPWASRKGFAFFTDPFASER